MHFWILLLTLLTTSRLSSSESNAFNATKEWQEIREGQGIPAGLHVRINLQTGKKEAKLLDETEQQAKDAGGGGSGALSTLPEEKSEEHTKKLNLEISEKLERALKDLPKEQLSLEYSPEKLEEIKRKYKNYKELKESYNDLKHSFKSDAEVITLLMQEYGNISKAQSFKEGFTDEKDKTADLLRVLDNFNYLTHQIDNALWFIDEGGLDVVLLPLIVNQTNVALRVQAMRVLGALTQNNPKAQIKVFEKNFGSHLAQILISSTHTDELSTALYAFGSLLRKFPLAQQRILSKSGTQALVAVIAKECELKIKAKAVTLINDMIVEKESVLHQFSNEGGDEQAAAQYSELNLPEWLQINGYCDSLDAVISSKLYEFIEQPDLTEYFIHAVKNTQSFCMSRWSQSPQLRHTLLTIKNRYTHTGEEYRLELAQNIDDLVKLLYKQNPDRTEL